MVLDRDQRNGNVRDYRRRFRIENFFSSQGNWQVRRIKILISIGLILGWIAPAVAQVAPSAADIASYRGLHKAAHSGDLNRLKALIADGGNLEVQDGSGRTPLHVAVFASREDVVRVLARSGANMDALENSAYDIVTIAAVADDFEMLDLVLSLGAKSTNITSPYDGTALIAAAHLGHAKVVERLIEADAPIDHVNNLGWTALLEAVILGNGGPNYQKIVKLLLQHCADTKLGDRQGLPALEHARARDQDDIVRILESARDCKK